MNTNNMFSFLIGTITGVIGGIAVKDKIMPSSKEGQLTSMVNNLTEQNSSLKTRCSEAESRLAESKSEIEALKSKVRRYEDKGEDDDDAIMDLKKANKKLLSEKDMLSSELAELKSLLTAKDQELEELKGKLFDFTNK